MKHHTTYWRPTSALLLGEDHKLSSICDEDFHLLINQATMRWAASGKDTQKANQDQ